MSASLLPLLEAFKWRHSVRSFAGGSFIGEVGLSIDSALSEGNSARTPFSTAAQLKKALPGTSSFGVVRGEAGWIFPAIPRDTPKSFLERARTDAAVQGQVTVMELSKRQIRTIWLEGYGKRSADRMFPGFETVAAIAYGIGETGNLTIPAKLAKFLSRPHTRKPIQTLFWDVASAKPYTEESAKDLLPFFQAIRSGPSAVNRQPWRFAVDGSTIHVFKTARDFASGIDIGIAIGNIEVLALENNHKPGFAVLSPAPHPYLGGSYVCSVSFRN